MDFLISNSRRRKTQMLPVLFFVCAFATLQTADVAEAKQIMNQACPLPDPQMDPKHEVFRGQDFVWQIPPNPKAVLFLLHGSDKDPFSFFDRGPGCELCYGLPEDRTAVIGALRHGYAVIALKSVSNRWVVWPLATKDTGIATDLVKAWTREHSLELLPLLGWGHSYGGWMLTTLTFLLPFRAVVLMCSEGELEAIQLATPGQFPPAFFVYMLNDDPGVTTTSSVRTAIATLEQRGIPVKERLILHKPLSPTFLAEQIDCMTENMSRNIYGAFKDDGSWLDDNDYMYKSLFLHDWRPVMKKSKALPFCEEFGELYLELHVRQELGVAQGYHSFTREANAEIFSWLNSWVDSSASASFSMTSVFLR